MEVRTFNDTDEASVAALWKQVFGDSQPHNDPTVVIRRKRAYEKNLFFVAVDGARLIGTVLGGYDGHRGWIYSLAVDSTYRRQGVATALIRQVESSLRKLDCPKINLQVRSSNEEVIKFYEKVGYAVEDRVSMGKLS